MGKVMVAMFVVLLLILGVLWYHTEVEDLSSKVGADRPAAETGQDGILGEINEAVDGLVGVKQVEGFQRAKVSVTKADIRAYETAVTMFYLQNNRLPKDLKELRDEGCISADALNDPWGQPFRSEVKDNKLIIYSSGRSRIGHTDDDIWAEISLK